jgi:hypothetical protein
VGSSAERLGRWSAEASAWIRSAPVTYIYLLVLLVTSSSLQLLDPALAHGLLRAESTNYDNLTDHPVQVLILSAFWTTGSWLPWTLVLLFTVFSAPAERRLGPWRWLLVFVAGHVGATLLTVAGIAVGLRHDLVDPALASTADVGVSYGLYALVGATTWLVTPGKWRAVWVAAAAATIAVPLAEDITFTAVGHVLALLIGLAFFRLVRRWQRDPVPRAVCGGRWLTLATLLARTGARRK